MSDETQRENSVIDKNKTDILSLLTNKNVLISAYIGVGVMVALYCWIFGDTSHKSFAYNMGRGLVWPAVMFPSFGKAVGSLLLVAFIAYVVLLR